MSPGVWLAEWSRKHPFGVRGVAGGTAMAMCPGTGLLSQMIERGLVAGSCRRGERARGLVTLPVCGAVAAARDALPAGVLVWVACAVASRW